MELSNNEINFNKKELNGLKLIGTGRFANCYLYDDNTALKIYVPAKKNDFSVPMSLKKLQSFLGIQNDTYVFPQRVAYCDGYFIGYTMPYIKAKNLIDKKDFQLIDLERSIKQVEKDTKLISKLRIITLDVNPTNILFNKRIKIIDPDNYFMDTDGSSKSIYKNNISQFNSTCLEYISLSKVVDDYLVENPILDEAVDEVIYENGSLANVMKLFRSEVQKLSDNEVKTYSDAKRILRKRNK